MDRYKHFILDLATENWGYTLLMDFRKTIIGELENRERSCQLIETAIQLQLNKFFRTRRAKLRTHNPNSLDIVLEKTPHLIQHIRSTPSTEPFDEELSEEFSKACLILLLLINKFINNDTVIRQEDDNYYIEDAAKFLNHYIEVPQDLLQGLSWDIKRKPWLEYEDIEKKHSEVIFTHPIKIRLCDDDGYRHIVITIEHPTVYNILYRIWRFYKEAVALYEKKHGNEVNYGYDGDSPIIKENEQEAWLKENGWYIGSHYWFDGISRVNYGEDEWQIDLGS
jgi:hypothetical protein